LVTLVIACALSGAAKSKLAEANPKLG